MMYWLAVMRTLVFDKCKVAFMSLWKEEKQTDTQLQRTTLYIIFMLVKNHVFMLIIFAIHRYLWCVAGNTYIFIIDSLMHIWYLYVYSSISTYIYIIWIYMNESTLMLIVMIYKYHHPSYRMPETGITTMNHTTQIDDWACPRQRDYWK